MCGIYRVSTFEGMLVAQNLTRLQFVIRVGRALRVFSVLSPSSVRTMLSIERWPILLMLMIDLSVGVRSHDVKNRKTKTKSKPSSGTRWQYLRPVYLLLRSEFSLSHTLRHFGQQSIL